MTTDDLIVAFCRWVLAPALIVVGLAYLLATGMSIYYVIRPQITINLQSNEWTCTKEHQTTQIITTHVGKLLLPQVTLLTECIQYNKLGVAE